MHTSEVLNRAADLIEERGWTQGVGGWDGHQQSVGTLCLEGGLMAAGAVGHMDRGYIYSCPAYRAVKSYLADTDPLMFLFMWNDRPNHTAAEVIEVLRAAALIEAAKEAPHEDAANVSRTEAVSA